MFKKDLLLFDLECTGLDVTKHEVIQLAAILLDKKTLKQKKSFASYIKPRRWAKRDAEAMAVNKITWDQLKSAPPMGSVLKKFIRTFGSDVTPVMYGGNLDIIFFPAAFRSVKMKYPFTVQYTFNLWPLCYFYMAKHKSLNNPHKFAGFTLEDVGNKLGIKKVTGRHDALVDCEYEADVLRGLVKALK
jgi:DNA polymerase III epsilon subunit-like protein